MALILENSDCPLCGELLKGKEIEAFPTFIENPLDDLIFANDAAFHRECLEKHPLYERLMERWEICDRARKDILASKHECMICHVPVSNPDECFGLGFFTYDSQSPLYPLNYRVCHDTCLVPGAFAVEIADELRRLKSDIHSGKIACLLDCLGIETVDHSCVVCSQEITGVTERFYFGDALFKPPHLLSQFNNRISHYRCLSKINYGRYLMEIAKRV